MNSNIKSFFNLRFFDEISQKRTFVHSIHPISKLIVTLVFIVFVIAEEKYSLSRLLPLCLYPFIIIPLAELPAIPLFKRALFVIPFVAGIGIFNPLFDANTLAIASGIYLNAGWLSFCTLIVKALLSVSAALMLFATTGIENISLALRTIRVPKLFVLQLLLTFRFISLLSVETARLVDAYSLRAPSHKGIAIKAWGPLAGQLLIRTFGTAQKVYAAMSLRGFEGEYHHGSTHNPKLKDFIYVVVWLSFFITVYLIDIPAVIGNTIQGGLH